MKDILVISLGIFFDWSVVVSLIVNHRKEISGTVSDKTIIKKKTDDNVLKDCNCVLNINYSTCIFVRL